MSVLVCPVCGNIIKISDKMYSCEKSHSFDIHKSGYVNLLPANKKNSKLPGDNKLMVEARRSFLNAGYYNTLLFKINEIIDKINPVNILDAGCGEGYYTNGIYKENRNITGLDISKTAVNYAARSNKNITYAVAGVFDMPIKNSSIDLIFTAFAPYAGNEFLRILKTNGKMLMVIPGKSHLFELKSIIYEKPYENSPKDYALTGFDFVSKTEVTEKIIINSSADIDNLFKMTPYYYRTKKEDSEKISRLERLETTLSFEILEYIKKV